MSGVIRLARNHRRQVTTVEESFATLDDFKGYDEPLEFALIEQEGRVTWSSESGLRTREGFVDEDARRAESIDESGEERSMQIVDADNHVEAIVTQ